MRSSIGWFGPEDMTTRLVFQVGRNPHATVWASQSHKSKSAQCPFVQHHPTWQYWLQSLITQGFCDIAQQGILLKEMPAAALVHISCFIPPYSNGKMQGSPVFNVLLFGSSVNESWSWYLMVFDELHSTNDYLPWDIPLCNCPILKQCMLFHTMAFHPSWNLPWPRCICCASSHQTRKGIHMGHSDHYELSLSSSILVLLRIIKYLGFWIGIRNRYITSNDYPQFDNCLHSCPIQSPYNNHP